MWRISIFVGCLLASTQVYSQQRDVPPKYESANELMFNSSLNLNWYGNVFYYRWDTPQGTSFYRGETSKSKPEFLFEEKDVREALAKIGVDAKDWKLYSIQPSSHKNSIKFSYRGLDYIYEWGKKKIIPVEKKEKEQAKKVAYGKTGLEYWKKFAQDSTAYVFAKGHQLFIKRKQDEKEIQLTKDGESNFSFNISSSVNDADSMKYGSTSAMWVGDYIISWREDKRHIADMSVINSLTNPRPSSRTYKFPIPGDSATTTYSIELWDSKTLSKRSLNLIDEKDQRLILPGQLVNGKTYLYAPRLGENSQNVYFLRRNRKNNRVELCRLDFKSGDVTVLIDETTSPHINEQLFYVHILEESKDILFWSERDGFGKYYRYDMSGKLLNRVGPAGNYVVGAIHYLDTLSQTLFLEVYGFQENNNPYLKQYIRAELHAERAKLLTDKIGFQHDIKLSDNKRYFLDQYSSVDKAPAYSVVDTSGKLVMSLGQANTDKLQDISWKAPEAVKVLSADGLTSLYGLIYKPFNFDSSKHYPVISSVYPGPQDDYIPHAFSIDDNYHQSLADLGFIVVQVASRGSSPYRGLKFHSYSYGNMRDYPLADNKLAIQQLAKDRAYMDLDRVGIFGHSGGGFMSATAILTYPEFYKVAVAASGNYDPNIYTQWWGETYHGLSPDGKTGYIPTTMELAENLRGKLLLITGDVDINVHPANTMRLANALINANKYFDMMILPGKDHGLGDAYYQKLIQNYFLNHLTKSNEKMLPTQATLK